MVIGVTGSLGRGKTAVSKMFGRLGAYVINADNVCHSLMEPGKKIYKEIVRHFGKSILMKNQAIDRKRLAGIVFKDDSKRKLLNRLVHPEAIRHIKKILKKRKGLVVIDAALLIESGFYKSIDKLIVVKANRDRQIRRLAGRKTMTRKEILRIFKAQSSLKKKLGFADYVIDNNGSKKQTLLQVEKIWKQLGVGYGRK